MINISMIKSSCFNGCRNYVGNWSHLEAAEKVCSEDFTQPRSGEKRSGAPSSRRSPLPGRLLCKYERYFCNKYQYIFAVNLMSLVIELFLLSWNWGQLLFPTGVCRVFHCLCGMDWKCKAPSRLILCFQDYSCSKLFTKLLKLRRKLELIYYLHYRTP